MRTSCVKECLEKEVARLVMDLARCCNGDRDKVCSWVCRDDILSGFLDVIVLWFHVLNIHQVGIKDTVNVGGRLNEEVVS